MARECGWDKDFIAEKFTEKQLKRYCDLILEEKMKDIQLQTIAISQATGYSGGNIKAKDFKKFIDSLDVNKKSVSFDDLKKLGYDIEEK